MELLFNGTKFTPLPKGSQVFDSTQPLPGADLTPETMELEQFRVFFGRSDIPFEIGSGVYHGPIAAQNALDSNNKYGNFTNNRVVSLLNGEHDASDRFVLNPNL